MSQPPSAQWEEPLREVALVALGAAVLTRRIFLPPARRRDLSPAQWQLLLALALTDTAEEPSHAPTLESLSVQLSLDRDEAHELLFELMRARLVTAVEPHDDEDPARFRLTPAGWERTRAYAERAGRFLPGWPPPAPRPG